MKTLEQKIADSATRLFDESYKKLCVDNDRVFALLLALQWVAAVVVALLVSPRTWIGEQDLVNVHVYAAIILGGLLSVVPVYINWKTPGAVLNRYINVIAQGLYSALFIHLSGGRIETHFHVFGSLAFFAFYRDIPVLLTGTVIVAVDHLIRGIWFPASAFGIFTTAEWRWLEHAGWVVFEDFFLGYSCIRGISEMKIVARKTAEVMAQHEIAENLVEQRTAELRAERNELQKKNETISTIYENVQSGFLLIDGRGVVQEGFTESIATLLNPDVRAGMGITSALALNERQGDHFLLLVEQIFEDIFPEHVSLAQLPAKYQIGNKTIRLESSVVRDADEKVRAILFTISDISDLERTERENQINKSLVTILQQKGAFTHFLAESRTLIEDCHRALKAGDQKRLRFQLHTMKGNASLFGMDSLAEMIHQIEDESEIKANHVESVENHLKAFVNSHGGVLGVDYENLDEDYFTVTRTQLGTLGRQLNLTSEQKAAKHVVSRWIVDLKRKPAKELVSPITKAGAIIAERLGKRVSFDVVNGDCMLDADYLRPVIQTLSHLVRNAVDHGVEGPEMRGAKSETATVRVECGLQSDNWFIKITDDGRGINVDSLTTKALDMKYLTSDDAAKMSYDEKLQLIFRDGLSTASSISYLSGRGVGMSAVAEAVAALSGSIKVSSEANQGTEFYISIPLDPREALRDFEDAAGEGAYTNGMSSAAA